MADLAFIVDSSGSISTRNFARLKEFLRNIILEFDIGPDAVRVAIIVYSTLPQIELKFNDLQGNQLTAAAIIRKLDNIKHQRGLTYIDKALRKAEKEVFIEGNGARDESIAKVSCFFFLLIFSNINIQVARY